MKWRDKDRFIYVLNYLRTKKLVLPNPELDECLYAAILDEFDYFCIPLPWYSQNSNSILILSRSNATPKTLDPAKIYNSQTLNIQGPVSSIQLTNDHEVHSIFFIYSQTTASGQ